MWQLKHHLWHVISGKSNQYDMIEIHFVTRERCSCSVWSLLWVFINFALMAQRKVHTTVFVHTCVHRRVLKAQRNNQVCQPIINFFSGLTLFHSAVAPTCLLWSFISVCDSECFSFMLWPSASYLSDYKSPIWNTQQMETKNKCHELFCMHPINTFCDFQYRSWSKSGGVCGAHTVHWDWYEFLGWCHGWWPRFSTIISGHIQAVHD